MNEVFWTLQDIFRLTAPVVGLAIAFLAWKRFPSSGAKLALIGFTVIASGAIARALFDLLWDPRDLASARDWSLILNFSLVIALIGMLIVVIALRKLIALAEATETNDTVGTEIA